MPIPKTSRDEASSGLKTDHSGLEISRFYSCVECVWALGGPGVNWSVDKKCRK